LNYWWDRYPVLTAIGVTSWTVNRIGWATGYYRYRNPYVGGTVVVDNSVYNYSQPIIIESQPEESSPEGNPASATPPNVSAEALGYFDTARQNFYAGKHVEALDSVNAAIKEMPNDAVLHEFRALVLFALKKYQDSAATLHAVLSAGPGWDWTTMSGLYPDVATYTVQLRALEEFRSANLKDPSARLILAYHYMTAGHMDAAKSQLEILIGLTPDDPLARNLLEQADPDADLPKGTNLVNPPEVTTEIEVAKLVGTWKASRGTDSQFELKLGNKGEFVWAFSAGKDRQELKGSYRIDEQGVISLDMGEDGIMPAQLVLQGDDKMDFYMLGDSQGAEPLKFSR
jgi:tetratricopeptide (TPR) repeat protein